MLRPSHNQVEAALDHAEATLERAVYAAVRGFLRDTTDEAIRSLGTVDGALVAAASEQTTLTLGEMYGWWTTAVASKVNPAVDAVWRAGYKMLRADRVLSGSLDELATYMAAVSDRLVRGLIPPLPDAAFDAVRLSITGGAAQGWSTAQVAERIAVELDWDPSRTYWHRQLAAADAAIDAILDPLGPPGTPAREAARLNDARVRVLQVERSKAVLAMDKAESYWKTRATLIARTESTGAYNAGALSALVDEGARCKEWLATSDSRTRPDHRFIDGTIVPIGEPFIVGGDELMMPGDPNGSPGNVCNCRCAMVGADCP